MEPIGLSPIPPREDRPPSVRPAAPAEAEKAAEDFAAVLLTFVVREMWKSASIEGEGLFGSGAGGEIHRGFVEGALASSLASGGFSGLTDAIAGALEGGRTRPSEE